MNELGVVYRPAGGRAGGVADAEDRSSSGRRSVDRQAPSGFSAAHFEWMLKNFGAAARA